MAFFIQNERNVMRNVPRYWVLNHVTYKPALVSIRVGAGVLERKGCSSSLTEAGFSGWLRM